MSTEIGELGGVHLRHAYADVGEVRLHYVEAGEGPLVVLLHGFPEFWFGWRHQIPALAGAGFRVVAPDLRGYNLSSRPSGVRAYALERLGEDVRALIAERGAGAPALLAGHDWGAVVAWQVAMAHPEVVQRLAILNVPHPRRMIEGLRTGRQLRKSWYMGLFQLPWLPERLVRARGWAGLRVVFSDARPGALAPGDIDRYIEAWSQPGAVTAGMNYYRAAARRTPSRTLAGLRPVKTPTLVIWGENDRALGRELAEPARSDVPGLQEVVYLDASHWVQMDQPDRVNELLIRFFSE